MRTVIRGVLAGTLVPILVLAGSTGKITGVVKDKKTGESLIGANVKLEGTSLGAASDIDGRYVILNVPPGEYSLIASMMGFASTRVTSVQVRIDLTTTVDVEMSETVISLGQEVVVVAERPLVQKDLTAKTAIVSGNEIQTMPVSEVGSVLSLQAGYVAGSLRGGRSGEVAYWIDGVPITDAYNGSQVVEVNKSLVQELQLVSGAFNAEYGQAMSGIVNIATKEGSSSFSGGMGIYGGDYLTSDKSLYPGTDFKVTNIRNVEANLSGPILGDKLTFFANGRYIYFNGYINGIRRFNPDNIAYTDSTGVFHLNRDSSGIGDSSVVPLKWSERRYGQAKLTWRVSPVLKITGNLIYDYTKSKAYDDNSDNTRRAYFYNPDGLGNNYNTSNTGIFQLSHTLSPSAFYTIGASYFEKDSKYYLYDLAYKDSLDAQGNYVGTFEVVNPNGPHYVHPKLAIPFDAYSFQAGGTDLSTFHRSTKTTVVKVDLTDQVDVMNMFKVGVEYRSHAIEYESIQLQPIASQSDINLAYGDPYIRTQIYGVSSSSHDYYLHHPREYSAYIQDKMEFSNIIVNIGIRFDYFQPDGVVLNDQSDPSIDNPIKPENKFFDTNENRIKDPGEAFKSTADRELYWYKPATAKQAWSPRLGVSFPITDRGIVHFSYGHFFQIPRFERLYENPRFKIGLGTGNQGVVGNADLAPEQTISGELGIQQQLTEDISMDVTAYLRDIRGLTGTRGDEIIVYGGASKYSRYVNSDFGYVKGLVLTVDKKFSSGFNATLDYTYQVARGSASDPQEARTAETGGALPNVQLLPLGWDQRHTLNIIIGYTAGSWGASSIMQYGSGTPYTPRSSTDISTILTNTQIKPSFWNMDVRAYCEVHLKPVRLVLFTRVFNVFDVRNEIRVFDDTGRAGFTTDVDRALATKPKQYVNSVDDYYRIPVHYSEPRRVELGMNLEF